MYPIIAYIKFLCNSTNQHGVHSPFVYNFVTKCLYDKKKYSAYADLTKYRDLLKKSNKELEVKDLGAGSKILDSNKRKVRDMIRASGSSKKESKLLFRVAQYFKFQSVLELGTSLGMGTYAFALANPSAKITSIDGCPKTSDYAKALLKDFNANDVILVKGNFKTVIPTIKEEKFDCIFFDGHHTKAATIQYFTLLLHKAHNESVFIFDDIYWSKEMTEAWEYIKAHKAVTVSVDCYHFGVVFFRKEQAKEHFKIRV